MPPPEDELLLDDEELPDEDVLLLVDAPLLVEVELLPEDAPLLVEVELPPDDEVLVLLEKTPPLLVELLPEELPPEEEDEDELLLDINRLSQQRVRKNMGMSPTLSHNFVGGQWQGSSWSFFARIGKQAVGISASCSASTS